MDDHRPEALNYAQVAAILSQILGRPICYSRPGVLRYMRHARSQLGMPWGMVAVTSAFYTTARLGLAADLTDQVEEVLGRPATSFATFAAREKAVWSRSNQRAD